MHRKVLNLAVMTVLASGSAVAQTAIDGVDREVTLQSVAVTAPELSDTQPVSGYQAKRSSTFTKTDTALRDVPQTISVITQDQMKDQSVQSVADAVRYVPGVQSSQGEGNRDAIVFRGNTTTGDFFMDGIRDDVQTYRDVYNTDRVEVLKGPNGMIFGRGGAGGAINRVTKEAGWDAVHELTLSLGDDDHKRIVGDFDEAINDIIAFRVNGVYEDSGSYRDGVGLQRYGINPTITVRPTDKTKVTLGVEYFKDEHVSDRGIPSVNGAGNVTLNNLPYNIGDEAQFFGNAQLSPNETKTQAFSTMIEHEFDHGAILRNRLRYADYEKYYQNVYASGPVVNAGTVSLGAYRDNTDRKNLMNQTDFIYDLTTGFVEHKLLLGIELARQETDNQRLQPASSESLGSVSASDPFIATASFAYLKRNQKSDVNITAFYLQDQIILTPKWQAVVGLRHDRFETDYTDFVTTSNSSQVEDSFVSPRAGLIFKPVEAVSFYGNYSQAYVPRAGDQLISLTATNRNFSPEKFINYELGAKWDVRSDLALTAAVYKLARENVQITDPTNASQQILVNGQETKGVELGIAGNIDDKWSVVGGYAYQKGEITQQQGSGNSAILAGAELAQTPKHTFSLWNRYDFNSVWGVALGVISRSSMYALSPTVTTSTILPGYTRYDAAIYGKLSEKLQLQVNLENLTNKEYVLNAHNNNNITPGSPVAGRATLIYEF